MDAFSQCAKINLNKESKLVNLTHLNLIYKGLQGFLNVRNSMGASSSSPSTSHINGITHQRPPMLTSSRPGSNIPQVLPPPHFPTSHPRPPSSSNPGLLGSSSSQMQVCSYSFS